MTAVTAPAQSPLTMADAITADDVLTVLHGVKPELWELGAGSRTGAAWTRLLRGAADLCGVDAVGMSSQAAVRAIVENF